MTMGMATNSVSSLCQLTKDASKTSRTSAGKRDGPSTAKSSNKRMKSTNYDPNKEDKEADYVPITNKASSNLLDENTWEEDPRVVDKHRKAFYLKAFPPPIRTKNLSSLNQRVPPSHNADHKPNWIISSMSWRIGKWAQRFVPCRMVQTRQHC